MIADTSFLIDLMRERENAVKKLEDITNRNISIVIPSVVVFELFIGLGRLQLDHDEYLKITNVLDGFVIIPFEYQHAKRAGVELGQLYQKGQPVDPIDAQIAGIALILSMPVITRNVKHFVRFDGVQIENY